MPEPWTWVEGTIDAPPQAVFEFFADDSDKLMFLVPQARVVGTPEREKLPNGGQRIRLRMNVLWRTREVVSEDTAFEPYSLLRGWSRSRTLAVEGEKRFIPTAAGTHIVWGSHMIERRGLISKLGVFLTPAYGRLSNRIGLLRLLARSRAALEVSPAPQAVTEPSWTAARVAAPTAVPFAWMRLAVFAVAVSASLVLVLTFQVIWPPLSFTPALQAVGFLAYMAIALVSMQLLSLAALKIVPTRLPDRRTL